MIYYTYILDKEHYAGYTHDLMRRLREHRVIGRDCSTFQIVGSYATKEEAREHEDRLHLQGYKGFWDNAKPIWQINKKSYNKIKLWDSGMLAAKSLGLNYYAIHNCLKGLSKSAQGYRWQYART